MNELNHVATEPVPVPAPVTALPALMATYPAGFDWEQPRPLKIGIHKDLLAAGFGGAGIQPAEIHRALVRYCHRPLYRKALRAGAIRVDLQGQPAGVVTAAEVEAARAAFAAGKARQAGTPVPPRPWGVASAAQDALPPPATPLPKEHLVPGRLELTVKFSELPQPLPVQGGLKIGVQTAEGIVTAILPAKVWKKFEQAAQTYPHWVAALSGSLERFTDGEIALQHPALQVFEKKARPEAPADAQAPDPNEPAEKGSAGPAPLMTASAALNRNPLETQTPVPPPAPLYSKLSLKRRDAPKAG
jgi:hypothetical protein